jgi:hypothetical protein
VQQGVESFFATQRILVDLAMRQNTSAMNSIREEISRPVHHAESGETPKDILVEIAVEGTANYIEAQRILLDLAQQENEIVLNGVKERVDDNGTAAAMTNILRRSIDTFIEMEQRFLTIASKRTQGWLNSDDSKAHNTVSLAGEAMKEFVATQKKFLDVISEETRTTDGKKDRAAKKDKTDLAVLGRNAADSFINAQKKLLDVASQQANMSMSAASRAVDLKMPIRLMPMADAAGEGVRSFVDAEKALVDTIVRARNRAPEAVADEVPSRAKRAARRPKPAKTKRRRAAAVSA